MTQTCQSGIHEIVNTETGKRYVGSAQKFRVRFANHQHLLRRGKHHSRKLQRSWDKHGAAAFQFRPIIICAVADLLAYEQIAINAMTPEYNVLPIAGTSSGHRWTEKSREAARLRNTVANPFAGRKHSAETIALMSAAKMGNTATRGKPRNPEAVAATAAAHQGMKRSPETRARISAAMTGKTRKVLP